MTVCSPCERFVVSPIQPGAVAVRHLWYTSELNLLRHPVADRCDLCPFFVFLLFPFPHQEDCQTNNWLLYN